MSKKLLAGAVAGALALSPTVASAARSHPPNPTAKRHQPGPRSHGGGHPAGPAADRAKDAAVPIWQTECILGSPGACPGYTFTCFSPLYPKQLPVATNSDTTEDVLEHYLWRCYGAPDNM